MKLLYAFDYFDPLRRRWVRARYRAEEHEIRARYGTFRLVGEPEIREVPDDPLVLTAGHLAGGKRRE